MSDKSTCRLNFLLDGGINWLVNRSDPAQISIRSLPGWHFAHPLYAARDIVRLDDNRWLLLSQSVVTLVGAAPPTDPEDLVPIVERFLRNLRGIARQPELSVRVAGTWPEMFALGDQVPIPERAVTGKPQEYILSCAATTAHIQIAAGLGTEEEPPIYVDVLLEAIASARARDHRKAVLYSAIALESCAQELCDGALHRAISSGAHQSLRSLTVKTHVGEHTKDPVYEFLRERASFKNWLHEIPLYVLRRSMQSTQPNLYKMALGLASTRNKLAHTGRPSDGDDSSALDLVESADAITCAIACLKWFGVSGTFPHPLASFTFSEPDASLTPAS